jgi:hypothetical protein
VQLALSVIRLDKRGSGGAVGLTKTERGGSRPKRPRLEREQHRRTRVGQVEERGDRRVLIEDVKSSGSAKQDAIPETDALYRKRQRTFNNITKGINIYCNISFLRVKVVLANLILK